MAQVKYTLFTFNASAAASGKLCVMVNSAYGTVTSGSSTIANIEDSYQGATTDLHSNCYGGAGICRVTGSNEYTLRVNGINYTFNYAGLPANAAARTAPNVGSSTGNSWRLYLGENQATIVDAGVDVIGTTSGEITRGSYDPDAVEYGDPTNVVVDNMSPRDQFAAQALRGMMSHIEDPSSLSNSEMQLYCDAAYQWAANMMTAAANSRVAVSDSTASSTAEATEVGTLDNNTEKLLNNIIVALERTDLPKGTTQATWYKGSMSVPGPHTDAQAALLPNSGTTYANVAAAEADGWKWVDSQLSYAERIAAPEVEDKLNSINASIGASPAAATPETIITVLKAIQSAISTGGGGGSSFDGNILSMPDVNIGSSGIGRDSSHPIYISGGGFPTKSALAAEFYGDTAHGQVNKAEDFVAFNYNGAVGYITADELAKRMNINTLISSALSAKLAGAYVEVGGTRYNVVFPNV